MMKANVCLYLLLTCFGLGTGLSLGSDKPKEAPKPAKEESYTYYAKVEVQGMLLMPEHAGQFFTIKIPHRTPIPLSLKKSKGWKQEALEKCNGRDVRVTGTLEFVPVETKPGVIEDQLAIVADTLKFLEKELPPWCPAHAATRTDH